MEKKKGLKWWQWMLLIFFTFVLIAEYNKIKIRTREELEEQQQQQKPSKTVKEQIEEMKENRRKELESYYASVSVEDKVKDMETLLLIYKPIPGYKDKVLNWEDEIKGEVILKYLQQEAPDKYSELKPRWDKVKEISQRAIQKEIEETIRATRESLARAVERRAFRAGLNIETEVQGTELVIKFPYATEAMCTEFVNIMDRDLNLLNNFSRVRCYNPISGDGWVFWKE